MKTYVLRIVVGCLLLAGPAFNVSAAAGAAAGGGDAATICKSLASSPDNKAQLANLKRALGQIPDKNSKARYGAIYCLGALATGQTREWSEMSPLFSRHYQGTDWVKLLAPEVVSDLCEECKGAGYSYDKCPRCKESGQCAACDGKGSKAAGSGKAMRCVVCNGTGDCPQCQGSGVTMVNCSKCNRQGSTLSPTAANELYLRLLKNEDIKTILETVNERVNLRQKKTGEVLAIRKKETDFINILKTIEEKGFSARIRVLQVVGRQGVLAAGQATKEQLPDRFLISGLPNAVDGDTWEGLLYSLGRLSIGPQTFRVYTASKKIAALAALREKQGPEEQPNPQLTGTGWFCNGPYVITCYHVIHDRQKLWIVSETIKKTPVKLVLKDVESDIAVLQLIEPIAPPAGFPLNDSAASLGQKVFTIGFPHLGLLGNSPKLTEGSISSLAGLKDDPRTLQVSVPVQSGNSGGPLINMNGEVVGIVAAKLAAGNVFRWTGDLPQNINYAVKVRYLTKLLETVGPAKNAKNLPVQAAALDELAKRVQNSIVQVFAE